jgi:curved DNA-binding protein CbpA
MGERPRSMTDASQNLYETLGVDKNATLRDMQLAFRKAAKQCHPDMNGGQQSDKFDEIRLAMDILSNPESRKLYDDYGVIPGKDDLAKEKMQAVTELTKIFLDVLKNMNPASIEKCDLMGSMREIIRSRQNEAKKVLSEIQTVENNLKKYENVMKKRLKLKKNTEKSNIFLDALNQQILALSMPRKQQETVQRIYDTMLKILKDYGFNFDEAVSVQTSTTNYFQFISSI